MHYLKHGALFGLLFMTFLGEGSLDPALQASILELDQLERSHPLAPYPSVISEGDEEDESSGISTKPIPAPPQKKPAPKPECCSWLCTLVKTCINYCCSKNS